jgi:hypothetical protein
VTLNTALAGASALIALAFAFSTWDRWLRRRRAHELAWTIAMVLFAVASIALWWAESRGWSEPSFRVFFAFGAVINVPWLGLGTVFLLAGHKVGTIVTRWLIGFSGFALGVIWVAPLTNTVDPDAFPTAKDLFGPLPRILAAVGSGIPAIVIFGGALWSAWRIMRGRIPAVTSAATRNIQSARLLAGGNVLIALGTVILSLSGTFSGRLGKDTSFVVTLLVGVVVLFVGFLVASNATRPPRTATHTAVTELLKASAS